MEVLPCTFSCCGRFWWANRLAPCQQQSGWDPGATNMARGEQSRKLRASFFEAHDLRKISNSVHLKNGWLISPLQNFLQVSHKLEDIIAITWLHWYA